MLKIASFKIKLYWLYSLFLLLFYFPVPTLAAAPATGGSTSCTATGGTDVIFLLDNSGSVLAGEYADYASTVLSIGNALRTANPATRIAVAHFAGPLSGVPFADYGQYLSLERDFSTAALSSPVRQFPSIYNYSEDNLAGAVNQLSYALDGNASTTSSFILSPLKELSRDLTRPLQIVIFTDAYRDGSISGSAMIDGVGYGYEPNDGSNFTIYNLLKAQGVKFSVAALTLPNGITTDERDKAAAAIASVGGSWTGIIESNPADPEGSQTSPRRYETSATFLLSAAQISNFVTPIANICPPNAVPVITSDGGGDTAAISVVENRTAVTTVTATDANGDTLTYSITGGADAAKFTIDSSTGVLQFVTVPDYEAPTDNGANNVYDVQVTVADGKGGTDMQAIAVTVTDMFDNPVPAIGGSGLCTATGGTDVLFLLDNSGSIVPAEYTDFASTVVKVGNALRTANSATRIAIAHYAGSLGGADFGQNVYFERNFSTASVASPVRRFTPPSTPNMTEDNMAGAIYQMSYALDGNASTTSSYIVGSLKELSRDLTRTLQIVIFTDATRYYPDSSAIIDGEGFGYEPNDGSNFTIYNLLKAQGVKFSITALSIAETVGGETVEMRDAAAAAVASVGGSWTGGIETNPNDPEGSQTSPRRFETTTNFLLNATQITNFVTPIANICPLNAVPVITSNGGGATAAISMAENKTAVTTVTATDADNDILTFSITGGADAAKFTINSSTGVLQFVTAPDYEAPTDSGANNVYNVQVTVADGKGGTDMQAIAVTITNVVAENAPPVITSNGGGDTAAISVPENQTAVTTVTATDANGDTLTYSITGGTDAAKFTINSSTGVLQFVTAPDFETPTDNGANNVYDVQVTVSDGKGGTDMQAIAVTVTNVVENVPPVITSNGGGDTAAISVAENQTAVTTVTATDADGDTLTYSITGGADAAKFTINSSTGVLQFVTAPDYEAPTDSGGNNVYDVQVTVSDGKGGTDMQAIAVTVTNVAEGVVLQVKGFLQGPFNAETYLMHDSLRILNIIPNSQPYTITPFGYTGTEPLNNTLLTVSGVDAITDWILVELRNATNPSIIVAQQAALLQRDGDVVTADTGSVNLTFASVMAGNYYVVLRHRNHLGVMSASAVALGSAPNLVDFTLSATAVYGNNARLVVDSKAVMWAGDANKSNQVIANGPNNDVNGLLGPILVYEGNTLLNSNYQLNGYRISDVDMNGYTLFAGPSNDTNLVIGNVLMHPGNASFSANFVVPGTIPNAQ